MAGYSPTDVARQALDAIYWSEQIADIEEGSDMANIILRAWDECQKQLLRAAHWDFARKQQPMQLLADVTGNTANVGTVVPYPWLYSYEYPIDCVKARFVPANYQNPSMLIPAGNIQAPATPVVTGLAASFLGGRLIPTRFLVASDQNNLPQIGAVPWDVPGVSPTGRTVILSNVKEATLVYTMRAPYPSVWDPLFRSAFVAYLASEIAGAIWAKKDLNMGLKVRDEQIKIVTSKVKDARAVSGNEGGPSTSDIRVDWMDNRRSGGPWAGGYWSGSGGNWGPGDPGVLGYGWDGLGLANGAVF
jgi:hypothetical protein